MTLDYIDHLLAQLAAMDLAARLKLLGEAADAHPNDARPLLLLAGEFMEARDTDRAEAAYTAAVLRKPDFWIARFQLGLLQFTSARPSVAMVTWAPLGSLEANHPLRLFVQAFERLAVDDFEHAKEFLAKGIVANTTNPPLNRDMELLMQRLSLQQPSEANPPQRGQETEEAHFLLSAYKTLQ